MTLFIHEFGCLTNVILGSKRNVFRLEFDCSAIAKLKSKRGACKPEFDCLADVKVSSKRNANNVVFGLEFSYSKHNANMKNLGLN